MLNHNPYYQEEGIKVYLGDCFEMMKEIPDKSVDLVLTDPPYQLDWRQCINFKNRKSIFHHREETQKWDINVRELYQKLFIDLDRIVKLNGSVILFVRSEFITWAVEEALKNNFDNKATIVWHKTNPAPQVRKKNYLSSIETILWVTRWDEKKCSYTFNFKTQNEMHNFIEMPLCGGKERTEHPTQKPLRLIKHIMEIHSNKNDTVLDPFLGSGTTLIACKELDRKGMGIEISQEYCDIAVGRIKNTIKPLI